MTGTETANPAEQRSGETSRAQSAGFRYQAILIAASLPVIFYGLGDYSLVHGDEGLYHAIARNMLTSGDFTRLEFTGEHRTYDTFLNAPLHYWAKAALIALLGDGYGSMRILSAAFGLLTVLASYRVVARAVSMRAGLYTGLILLTTFQFIYMHSARIGVLETLVSFALILSAGTFIEAVKRGNGFVAHHLCLVALMNLKLPLLVIPLAAELAFFALVSGARPGIRAWLRTGAWVLPLGLLWHIYQIPALGDESAVALMKMVGKATGDTLSTVDPGIFHRVSSMSLALLFGAFPYSIAYPAALIGAFALTPAGKRREALLLLALVPAALFVFFALVTKHYAWYVIPAYPFLSAFLGIWLDGLRSARRLGLLALGVAQIAALLLCIRVEIFDYNPFADRGLDVTLREIPGLGAVLPCVVSFVFLFFVCLATSRRYRGRFAAGAAVALTAVLLGYGGMRVLWPLQYTDYASPMAILAEEIDEKRTQGISLDFPIPVPERGNPKVRFFFGDDFEIIRKRDVPGVYFELVGEGQTPFTPRSSWAPPVDTKAGS